MRKSKKKQQEPEQFPEGEPITIDAKISPKTREAQDKLFSQLESMFDELNWEQPQRDKVYNLLEDFAGHLACDAVIVALQEGMGIGHKGGYQKALDEMHDAATKALLINMPQSSILQ